MSTSQNVKDPFVADISYHIWDSKYRWRDGETVIDNTIQDTWQRVAKALASVEPKNQNEWQARFYQILDGFKFLPGGRIMAGAGTQHRVTLFNCFVMGIVEDSMDGIFDGLKEGALTMQQGGGVGYDFSTLRPRGTLARTTGGIASGPVSFMRIWNTVCSTLLSTGARRGAMMATMRCDHPDIEEFIDAKQSSNELNHFNLSVQISDDFMTAVRQDDDWALVFPAVEINNDNKPAEIIMKRWTGTSEPVSCQVVKRVNARELWNKILRATYDYAEPGVLFVDRINALNNLWYCESISATNPCGEIPLPPYGACDLGSINLTQFVNNPFTSNASLDMDGIRASVQVAVRLLDNVIDLSGYPLQKQSEIQSQNRRIGLGLTGLANALIMMEKHYAEADARNTAASIMKTICHTAYRASIELAREKGAFPRFDARHYLQGRFIQSLPEDIRVGIEKFGIRNSHLVAIAPTGTISLLANNISSGLEPVYDFSFKRRVLELDSSYKEYTVSDYSYHLWQQRQDNHPLPAQFVTAQQLTPQAHLQMQAALQPYVDNSISKTINIPEDLPFESFKDVYDQAYDNGLKGCTTFRPSPLREAILKITQADIAPHCCNLEREAD
ncbi:MAG: adenosylcobalamin-dependent ribonucleoside-diphosphate reductase [Gammaproteobacteria bacterium]